MHPDDGLLNDEDKSEKIPGGQDGQPPFSAPDDVRQSGGRNDLHPSRDTDLDGDDEYQNGPDSAAGLQEDEFPDEDQHATRIG